MMPGLIYKDVNGEGAKAPPFPGAWQLWVASTGRQGRL